MCGFVNYLPAAQKRRKGIQRRREPEWRKINIKDSRGPVDG
jgi:hypothetical protein